MIRKNEQNLVNAFCNLNDNILEAQKYIRENYNVSSEYDESEDTLYIWSNNIYESLTLNAAKEYIAEKIGYEMINVIFGKKQ